MSSPIFMLARERLLQFAQRDRKNQKERRMRNQKVSLLRSGFRISSPIILLSERPRALRGQPRDADRCLSFRHSYRK